MDIGPSSGAYSSYTPADAAKALDLLERELTVARSNGNSDVVIRRL